MGKILKWIGIGLGVLVVGVVIFGLIANQPLPEGQKGPEADAMARQIEQAVDKAAWDTTAYVQWSFAGAHHYFWDKKNNRVEVSWGKNRVLLNLDTQNGKVWSKGKEVEEKKKDKLLKKHGRFSVMIRFGSMLPPRFLIRARKEVSLP
jgi:3',5'-cyclic AMP phosphodiesterase CpdA